MKYITKKSIEGLIEKLGLPAGDEYSQDWEYEIANSNLAIKLVNDYLNQGSLTEDEKFTLMHVILESTNDYYIKNSDFPSFEILKQIMETDYELHKETLNDWACWEQNDISETFAITPFIRCILSNQK